MRRLTKSFASYKKLVVPEIKRPNCTKIRQVMKIGCGNKPFLSYVNYITYIAADKCL
jgi:hypothetical protein